MADNWDMTTSDGSVTVTLPGLFNAELDAETSDGAVRDQSSAARRAIRGERRDGEGSDERRERRRTLRTKIGDGGEDPENPERRRNDPDRSLGDLASGAGEARELFAGVLEFLDRRLNDGAASGVRAPRRIDMPAAAPVPIAPPSRRPAPRPCPGAAARNTLVPLPPVASCVSYSRRCAHFQIVTGLAQRMHQEVVADRSRGPRDPFLPLRSLSRIVFDFASRCPGGNAMSATSSNRGALVSLRAARSARCASR
jgi:hypothetical protein